MGDCSVKWEVENSAKQDRNASLAELRHLINLTALEIQIHDTLMLPKDLNFEKLEKYKIIIGEIWDWSENYEASTTLKLKLGDSEHWVKALIKTVESMYLDEISDISTVLYQLNENELLKHLHIQNNEKIQHIVNSTKRDRASFPNLETLALNNLSKMEKICLGPLMGNSFSKLRIIRVKSCDQLEYLMLVSIVKSLSQLLEIDISECKSMKKIVFMECEDNDITVDKIEFTPLQFLTLQNLPVIDGFCSNELMSSVGEQMYRSLRTNIATSFFSAKLAFPNLETLKLSSINLNKIWDDDRLPAVASCIHNLANLTVENCGGLKYLFSSLMVESLTNLKHLEISKCDMMEDMIATERRSNGVELAEVRFSKLEKITIKDMKNLNAVWHHQFGKLKMLEVINCDRLGNIFPSHMQRTYESLETLTVSDCNLVEEIFELSANNGENGTSQLKQLTLNRLPKLKRIWSNDPNKITGFHNLQFVRVEDCEVLEYLFPFSIATDLHQVEEISLKQAFTMKEIVPKKKGRLMNIPVEFKFEHLTSLMLCNLPELKTFYAGNHSITCPSLKEINVFNCKKFKLFKTHRTNYQGRISDTKLHVSKLQTVFNNVQEVIENLEVWTLNSGDASTILQCQLSRDQFCKLKVLRVSMFKNNQATFPYRFLQNTSSLEWLVVEWSSFKEIFLYEGLTSENGNFEISTRIKFLRVYELHKLQHICKEGSQIDPLLEALEGIFVSQCSSLRYLVPSSIAFNHLTYLEVENCGGLVSLVTSSTARSMAKLTAMKVIECNSLEQIVTEEREDANKDIVFASLEFLELDCLPRLNKFCSSECFLNFPLLEKVVVRQCPRMTMFSARETSTPRLLKVLVEENGEEGYWEGDLNRTINKMSEDLVSFHSLKNLKLSEYPELQELWYGQVGNKVFSNLKSLVVQKCDFLSDVLLTWNLLRALSNMEELDVRDCDSLEVVLDLSGMNEQEMQIMKENIQLKKITVSNLPELKHIWKQQSREIVGFDKTGEEDEVGLQHQQSFFLDEKDPHATLRFYNLQNLRIEDCPKLEYLFPFSIALGLPQLEELHIESCGMKEIVAKKDGPMDEAAIFVLNHLTSLVFFNLHEFTRFYAGVHSLECKSLKSLEVLDCKKLKLFNIQTKRCLERSARDKFHFSVPQSLFASEEVIGNLETLSLNYENANTIFQGQVSWDLFSRLTCLGLSLSEDDQAHFLYLILQNIPSLENLIVVSCSFKEIFYDGKFLEDRQKIVISTRLKHLLLLDLHDLQQICRERSQIDPTLEVLETLIVTQCSSLIHLVPSSVAFNHLTYLEVEGCNRMVSLISSSTATSLVKLTAMKVRKCDSLEQIVAADEDETKDEIAFSSLEILELECLSSLKSFSSTKCLLKFPLLEQVIVKQCLSMRIFSAGEISTPELEKVLLEENDEECYWEGDLNQTITKMFEDLTTREKDEENHKESTSSISDSQPLQGTTSTAGALTSEEHVRHKEHATISEVSRGENLFNQTTTSTTADNRETIKADEMYDTIKRPFIQDAQNVLRPTSIEDAATEAQEMQVDNKRPLVQPDQNALSPMTVQDAAIDPALPQSPEAMTSSILASDAYTSYKGMFDISVQNLPYLEAGLDRHPQLLEWLNPNRGRVLASSIFSLVAEVTRLLRTTRRGDLSKHDRSYITQCCSCLHGVGFDASWLSYVQRCMEECGDEEIFKRTIQETEGKASTLKAQFESIKKELASLEPWLHDFIES